MNEATFDSEGFLQNLDHWNESVAETIALAEALTLTPTHWQLITLARGYYKRYEHAPNMRPLVNLVREQLGEEVGSSIALMRLFSDQPAKQLAKIAGLPKPSRCL